MTARLDASRASEANAVRLALALWLVRTRSAHAAQKRQRRDAVAGRPVLDNQKIAAQIVSIACAATPREGARARPCRGPRPQNPRRRMRPILFWSALF
jgi:hypothetical protein